MRRHTWRVLDSEDEEDTREPPTLDSLLDAAGTPERWQSKPLRAKKFIDDISAIEKTPLCAAIRTITQGKEVREIHASECESFYYRVAGNAAAIGMLINPDKTQLLCVTTAINYDVRCYINIDGRRLVSGDELKLVGYTFGRRPNADKHIQALRRKYGARSWIVRNMKKGCLLYTSPSPRDRQKSRMPSSA